MKKYIYSVLIIIFSVSGVLGQKRTHKKPENPDTLFARATRAGYSNHFEEATAIIEPLVAQYPKNVDYSIFYGALCSWMHKWDSSKTILRQVIAKNPKSTDAYDALTNTELWSKDDEGCIADCRKALLIPKLKDSVKEVFILKIAQAQEDEQKFAPAYGTTDSLVTINPEDTSAKNLRDDVIATEKQKTADSLFDTAENETNRKDYGPAEKTAKQITLEYPTNSDYKVLWSRLLGYRHKLDTSMLMLEQVIQSDPKYFEAYDGLADDELIKGNFDRSLSLADSGINLPVKGDRTALVITKASAEDNLKQYYEALNTLDTLVRKHPDNEQATDLYKVVRSHIRFQRADSLFNAAQDSAKSKNAKKKGYNEAHTLMDTILKWFPTNTDYLVFNGRLYSWQGKYDTSEYIINKAIGLEPHNMDAWDALTDAELWSKEYATTIRDLDKALSDSMFIKYPSMRVPYKDTGAVKTDSAKHDPPPAASPIINKDTTAAQKDTAHKDTNAVHYYDVFMFKRAQALYAMEDYRDCANTLDSLMKVDSTDPEANRLLTEVKIKLLKNILQGGFLANLFNQAPFGPWYYEWLQYTRNFDRCPVSVKVTNGSIYDLPMGYRDGLQYEVGAYPEFTHSTYGDATVAYSNSYAVFPKWQIAADLYQKLPLGFEVSMGVIYMHFIDVVDSPETPPQDVWILDPSISFYLGDKWSFSYRPYIAYKEPSIFATHVITVKRFFQNTDTWVGLTAAAGTSPFVDWFFPRPEPTTIEMIGIDYQTRLPYNFLIWPMVSYEYLEWYPPSRLWGNMYYFQIIITKRF